MQEFAVVAGVCMSYAVGYETSDFLGTRGWEWTFQAEIIPAFVVLFGMAYLPGRWGCASAVSEATQVLAHPQGVAYPSSNSDSRSYYDSNNPNPPPDPNHRVTSLDPRQWWQC